MSDSPLKHQEKVESFVKLFSMAMRSCDLNVNEQTAHLIAEVHNKVCVKRETFSLKDAAEIKAKIHDKYNRPKEDSKSKDAGEKA